MFQIIKLFFIYIPFGLFSLILHYSSKIIPKQKNLILFGAWNGAQFRGNSKLLFFKLLKKQKLKCIWITRNKNLFKKLTSIGIPCVYYFSITGIFYSLRANVYFITHTHRDINYFLSGGAKVINLMHYGYCIKSMGKKTFFFDKNRFEKFITKIKYPLQYYINCIDYVFYISDFQKQTIKNMYNLPDSNLKINYGIKKDFLLSKNYKDYVFEFELKNSIKVNKKRINIFFLPTLRKESVKFNLFNYNFNGSILNKFLSNNNASIYINFHPFDAKNLTRKNLNFDQYDNIKILSSVNDDNNIIMKDMDIFITDYSSVFSDFLLFDKPIILTPFDYSNYIKFDRNLINEYFDLPCYYAYDWTELLDILLKIIANKEDYYLNARKNFKNKLYPNLNSSGLDKTIELLDKAIL